MIESVLIANRGEIAVRIARACRDAGIRSIAVYSDADSSAEHVRVADDAVHLGPSEVHESYLSIDRLLAAAKESGADAVHPGYGLLSENPEFAARVTAAGLVFVGPSPEVIDLLGDKRSARAEAEKVGLTVLPAREVGTDCDVATPAAEVGYPLLVKAAFGGGGRGMRIVAGPDGLDEAIAQARRENQAAFGHADVYLERYLPRARHVEVQVLRDTHGNVVHLGSRDCTTQRRNQKLIEEAPAFDLAADLLDRALRGSVRLAADLDYHGAATVEFLVAPDTGELFFLEVNTRVQVEHTVTELITGIDIVATQLAIAAGEPLPFSQDDVSFAGHAIEVRVNAEDATTGFLPQTGTIDRLALPGGPWVRADSGVTTGTVVTQYYDSLLAKLAAWGPDRETARTRLARALHETVVDGLPTTTGFLARVLDTEQFRSRTHWTGMVDSGAVPVAGLDSPAAAAAAGSGPRYRPVRIRTPFTELHLDVAVQQRDVRPAARSTGDATVSGGSGGREGSGGVAPMDAVLVRHTVAVGDTVEVGTVVAVIESMKMETHVAGGASGVVTALHAQTGDSLRRGQRLVTIEASA